MLTNIQNNFKRLNLTQCGGFSVITLKSVREQSEEEILEEDIIQEDKPIPFASIHTLHLNISPTLTAVMHLLFYQALKILG